MSAGIIGFYFKKRGFTATCWLRLARAKKCTLWASKGQHEQNKPGLEQALRGVRSRGQACTIPERQRRSATGTLPTGSLSEPRCVPALGHAGTLLEPGGPYNAFPIYSMTTNSPASGQPHAKPVCASSRHGPARKATPQVC